MTGLFDDVVGHGWVLLTRDEAALTGLGDDHRAIIDRLGIITAHVGAPGSGAPITDVEGTYGTWLESIGASTVLIRPDFWLFGSVSAAADAGDLLDSLAHGLAGGFDIPARVPQPDAVSAAVR